MAGEMKKVRDAWVTGRKRAKAVKAAKTVKEKSKAQTKKYKP